MKNLEALKQKHKELGEEINKLEASKSWPSEGDYYWCIQFGEVFNSTWGEYKTDILRLQTRNIFKTKRNAALWLKIHNRVHDLIGDWKPDWGNNNQKKWFLSDATIGFDNRVFNSKHRIQGVTYMPEHAALTLINEFTKDELKLWMFGEDLC